MEEIEEEIEVDQEDSVEEEDSEIEVDQEGSAEEEDSEIEEEEEEEEEHHLILIEALYFHLLEREVRCCEQILIQNL